MSETKTEERRPPGVQRQKGVRKCANMSASSVYEPIY